MPEKHAHWEHVITFRNRNGKYEEHACSNCRAIFEITYKVKSLPTTCPACLALMDEQERTDEQ